jgi:hypothetical protein
MPRLKIECYFHLRRKRNALGFWLRVAREQRRNHRWLAAWLMERIISPLPTIRESDPRAI